MTAVDWGCEVCRLDLYTRPLTHIALVAESVPMAIRIYQCDTCGTWFKWDLSDRLFVLENDDAQALLAQIEKEA
ncbi:hypothetical protein [Demequina activiva]|uniref:Uncharacterized protein n=1 Tax=Demequina activiva TaxID=1582364 RepID=A0A919Q4T9_9MICO|nr:hypothetical protein [Demequina activiva]GIG53855.1 hypothetical protein Dac01nite_06070 [Demequina activiva]